MLACLTSEHDSPVCLPDSKNYRCEPPWSARDSVSILKWAQYFLFSPLFQHLCGCTMETSGAQANQGHILQRTVRW
jgi:hypothetical protein